MDVAVLTNEPRRCDYYKQESVKPKGQCVFDNLDRIPEASLPIEEEDCKSYTRYKRRVVQGTDGRTDRQIDRRMDGQMDEWKDGWMDRQTFKKTDRQIDRQTNGRMDRWTN